MSVRWSWSVARLAEDDGLPQPGFCASISRRRNMEAEEEWNKDLSAHKQLDKKVFCKQNGRIGETNVFHVLFKLYYQHSALGLLLGFSSLQGDLSFTGIVRTLHGLLKTQNTLQIQSITRSECAGRWTHGKKVQFPVTNVIKSHDFT